MALPAAGPFSCPLQVVVLSPSGGPACRSLLVVEVWSGWAGVPLAGVVFLGGVVLGDIGAACHRRWGEFAN